MSEYGIPVDLRNAGHVFACLGFAEAAGVLLGTPCESRYDYTGAETAARFVINVAGETNPFAAVIGFLREANVSTLVPPKTLVPPNSKLSTQKWNVDETSSDDRFAQGQELSHPRLFPNERPKTPATLPARIATGNTCFILDHWADGRHCGRDNVKFWAGAGGYPGSALARDVLDLIKQIPNDLMDSCVADPFSVSAPMTSSFRFDFRRDYIPLDAGFSPNSHSNVEMVGFPITEMLAVFGLQNARPTRLDRRDKLKYRYGISPATLPLSLARVVLGATDIGFPMRTFQMLLGWPGQAGQARCITDSQEDI